MAGGGHPAVAVELCRTISALHARGWCQGTSGNFSVTLERDPLRLLITPSGMDKGQVAPEDLVTVGADGQLAGPHSARPSAETLLHCALAEVAGAGAVLHVHSVANTLLSEHFAAQGGFTMAGYEMLKGLEGVQSHEARVFVPVLANRQDMVALSGEVRSLLAARPGLHGFLLAGHGLYTWGAALEQARRQVEIFEFLFECLGRRTRFAPFLG